MQADRTPRPALRANLTLAEYPEGRPLGFDELVLDLLAADDPPATFAFDGDWLDIGRPDDDDRANREFTRIKDELLPALVVR